MKRESGLANLALLLLALLSANILAANPAAASPPAKPAFTRISSVSPFEIDLHWRDKSTNEDGFQIERSTDRTNFHQIAQVLPGTTIYRDKNLFPGTRYFYRIRAFNSAGASRYDTISARTQTPVVPFSVAEWGYPLGFVTPTNTDLVSASAGAFHSLGLKRDGTVIAWGNDSAGDTMVPTNLNNVIAISAGDGFSLALKNDGTVVEWGSDGTAEINRTNNLTGIVAISAGLRHSVALKNDGTVVTWGFDDGGNLTPPPGLTGVVEIAAGDDESLALKSDGTVVEWGNRYPMPTNLTSVVGIAAESGLSVAIKSDGTMVAWGFLGSETTQATSNLTEVTSVALGAYQGVALKKDGSLFSWNLYASGAPKPDLSNSVVAISAQLYHHLALSTAPAAPSNPFLTVLSANQLRLSWQDNSPDEKSFTIERSGYADPNFLPWKQIATVNANATNFTDTTVQTGNIYTYRVRAIGKFGASPASYEATATLAPPDAPESPSATIGSTNQVNLTWYGSFNEINSFKIERAPDDDGSPGDWTEIASIPTSGFPQSFTDTATQANTTYWYRVRAFNFFGISDYSNPISINVVPPAAPQYLSTSTFADSATIYWNYNPANQGYKIERAPDVNGSPGAWTQIALLDAGNISQYTDRGLPLNATFWYRVRASNWVGDSDYSTPVSATILPPAPPNPVYVNIGTAEGVDISWNPAINDEDGFKLERAPDLGGAPGVWSEIASFNNTNAYQQSFHDTNVVAHSTYWYRVRSFNLFGFSAYSTPVSVSLLPPPAPVLRQATSHADSANLQWQDSEPNLLAFKIERAPDADGVPGAWTEITNLSNLFPNYTDPNLTPGATYWYRMRAVNWIGNSPYSDLTVVTIDPPPIPLIFSAALNPTNGVDLIMGGPVITAVDLDSYLIERAVPTDLGFINWIPIGTADAAGATDAHFTDTNATRNATNYYRIRTVNAAGISDYSAASGIAVVPPDAPFFSLSPDSGHATLFWWDSNFATEATLGYYIERAPDLNGLPGTWTRITTINGASLDGTYTDPGTTPGATYWYRMEAFNWVGVSAFNDPSSITVIPPTPPSPPSIQLLAISPTNHQADVYWYDNSADEYGIAIERAPDLNGAPGSWSPIGVMYETNSLYDTFHDTNAVAYTTNWYRIRALGAFGYSGYSAPVDLQIIPSSTPDLSAAPFGNQITLSWYDSDSYFDGVAGYKLERAQDVSGSPGTWTQLTNVIDSQYVDKNLAADASYWYRIRSYNWVGNSAYSDPVRATITPPGQPSNLFAALGATNTVLVLWSDFNRDEDGFKIERVADAGGYPGDNWQEIGSVNAFHADHSSFVDTNVIANTTNWYRVRAFSAAGLSDYDGDAQITVVPPDAPSEVFATPYYKGIQVSWFENFGPGSGGFVVQRAPDTGGIPGAWTDIVTNTQSKMFYEDDNLPSGATYWYRVRAFNWVGFSGYGSIVSAQALGFTPPDKPQTPSLRPGSTNQVFVSWFEGTIGNDGFKIQRAPDVGGAPGNWTEIGILYTSNAYSVAFTDTNVTANSTNWYRIQAFNSFGVSEFSDSNELAVIAPDNAPTITYAIVIGAHRIDLQWRGDFDFIQGFRIERAFDNGGTPGTWTLLTDQPAPDTDGSYSDISAAINKQYWYRVQSYNWSGNSPYSDPVFVNDAPPPAPSLTITNDQLHQFTLNWTKTSDNTLSIKIERAPDNSGAPGAWIQIAEPATYCGLVPTNYADIGIPSGETFWYRVRAVNAVGDSAYSSPENATEGSAISTGPTPAQILSLTQTNGGMLIEWSTTAGNSDVLQASGNFMGDYTNLSPAMVIGGSGNTVTNYFDAGTLTNASWRFYRIQSTR